MVNKLAYLLYTGKNSSVDTWLRENIYLYRYPTIKDSPESQQTTDFLSVMSDTTNITTTLVAATLALASNYPEYESLLGPDWSDKTYNFNNNNSFALASSGDSCIKSFLEFINSKSEIIHRILSRANLLRRWLDVKYNTDKDVKYDTDKIHEQFVILMIAIAINNPNFSKFNSY